MKSFICTAVLMMSVQALASGYQSGDDLSCQFTEPFITVEFDGRTQQITESTPDDWNQKTELFEPRVLGQGKVVALGGNKYSLNLDSGATVLTFRYDNEGSDGMSDMVYPFSAVYNGLMGGCSSNKLGPVGPSFLGF